MADEKKIKLNLFTNEFPFGIAETFLENEFLSISHFFDEVVIFTANKKDKVRPLPIKYNLISFSPRGTKIKDLFRFLFSDFGLSEIFSYPFSIRRISLSFSYFSKSLSMAEQIKKSCIDANGNGALFYSFWGDEWTLALAILKRKGLIKNFVFRVHGYDLYEERHKFNKIPFRKFVLSEADQVYPVSIAGLSYLVQKYPNIKSKTSVFTMGVYDFGISPLPDIDNVVVSCSNLIPLKRVHLIAEALSELNIKVKWVHFGDGREYQKIIQILEKSPHVNFIFMGRVSNKEIINFYKFNAVSLFIQLSETEGGIPVSIQEAVSFGIPIVATNVGGINEIVNEKTGVLLPSSPDIHQITNALSDLLQTKSKNKEFRLGVRDYWKINFNAKKVYSDFANNMIEKCLRQK